MNKVLRNAFRDDVVFNELIKLLDTRHQDAKQVLDNQPSENAALQSQKYLMAHGVCLEIANLKDQLTAIKNSKEMDEENA